MRSSSEDEREMKLIDVVSASLEVCKDSAISEINKESLDDQKISATDAVWVLTVPAIWSEFSKRFMRTAAFRAGLIEEKESDRLTLCLEPEGAAIECFLGDRELGRPVLQQCEVAGLGLVLDQETQ